MVKPQQIRMAAFLSQLNAAADEYRSALNEIEGVRQRFEAAKAKLGVLQRRAADVLPRHEHSDWQYHNADLWAVGADIGDAILAALRAHALDSAIKSLDSKGVIVWDATATTTQIVDALDEHGFAWRTGTPRREVHAALLRLKGITKTKDGRYGHSEAREIYIGLRESYREQGLLDGNAEDKEGSRDPR